MSLTVSGAVPAGTVGPEWADTSGRAEVVLNPLRVQNHVQRKVADYVPGLTAVTPHARYYSLHPWLVAHAAEADLSLSETYNLIRRAEVAVAWASMHHDPHISQLPIAHGRDMLGPHISGGTLDLASASRRGQYSPRDGGFLQGAYSNPETVIGVLAAGLKPGARFDTLARSAASANLVGLLDAVRSDHLSEADGTTGAEAGWCVCSARIGDEGIWLRRLFGGTLPGSPPIRAQDLTRQHTLKLLAWSIAANPGGGDDPEEILRRAVIFSGPIEQSPVAELAEYAEHWQGLLLRHYTVTAWRRLWADIVDTVAGAELTVDEISRAIGDACPDETLATFASRFDTSDENGFLPAEMVAWEQLPGPAGHLAVLCISARRTAELAPVARAVFTGNDRAELGPEWISHQLSVEGTRPLREWVAALCQLLLVRAQRIGLDKFRIDPRDGRAIVPAQVTERDGLWSKSREVGRAPLGLRISSLATIAAGCGLLDHNNGTWEVAGAGTDIGLLP